MPRVSQPLECSVPERGQCGRQSEYHPPELEISRPHRCCQFSPGDSQSRVSSAPKWRHRRLQDETSNSSWRQGIKGEMTCTGYVALVWNIIYRTMTIIVIMIIIIMMMMMMMMMIDDDDDDDDDNNNSNNDNNNNDDDDDDDDDWWWWWWWRWWW